MFVKNLIGNMADSHGGRRVGAGAKPKGDEPKTMMSKRVSADIVRRLKKAVRDGNVEDMTEGLEKAVRAMWPDDNIV